MAANETGTTSVKKTRKQKIIDFLNTAGVELRDASYKAIIAGIASYGWSKAKEKIGWN